MAKIKVVLKSPYPVTPYGSIAYPETTYTKELDGITEVVSDNGFLHFKSYTVPVAGYNRDVVVGYESITEKEA